MKQNSIKDMIKLSFGEEVANSISHGVMAVLCLLILPFSSIKGYLDGGLIQAIGISIFVISIFLMFLISCLFHSMKYDTNQKTVFRILDHCFIYVAIAGSYTPIALCVIEGWQGILILIIQWAMVVIGVLYKSIVRKSTQVINITIYLMMGWVAILFIPVLLKKASVLLMLFILLGGLFYSAGTYFYNKQYDKKYYHMIWHFFINIGAISHLIGIIFFLNS